MNTNRLDKTNEGYAIANVIIDEKQNLQNTLRLPLVIFKEIFSWLDEDSIKNVSLVNYTWLYISNSLIFDKVNKFILFVEKILPKNSCADDLKKNIPSGLKFISTLKFKFTAEESIVSILKILEESDFSLLEKNAKNKCKFIAHFLDSAILEKEISNALSNANTMTSNLEMIAIKLRKQKKINKAIEVINLIPTNFDRDLQFQIICEQLLENHQFCKAVKIAETISNKFIYTLAWSSISIYYKENQIEKDLKLVESISKKMNVNINH